MIFQLVLVLGCVALISSHAGAVDESVAPPRPYGPVLSARQLRWHELKTYAFLHFSVNTFTDKEWGYGDESPTVFQPTDFDAEHIVTSLEAGGSKGVVLTCNHHDGFCLWPSKYTEHLVKNSPWKGGKGDVVKEISAACRRHGLKFGVYLSPWDRNHKDYGRAEYVTYYRNQLRELLTGYGPIFEVWFDGANGGDGCYGGDRTTRRIDPRTYEDWENTWKLVRELQPEACMFSDIGPDVRWVGNESGVAGDPCWAAFSPEQYAIGGTPGEILNRGIRGGSQWLPAEVDVSIRPGWFYHAAEDDSVKSVNRLIKLYFESVGRGCNLILNVPPDRRGRIHEYDARALREWGKQRNALFATDLARAAKVSASSAQGNDPRFAARNVVDGNGKTYWASDDQARAPELIPDLPHPATFDAFRLREYLPLGQRVERFALDFWNGHGWEEIAAGTSIGSQRIMITRPVTTVRVRLRIVQASACPAISELSLFSNPAP